MEEAMSLPLNQRDFSPITFEVPSALDAIDRRIAAELQAKPRLRVAELARRVGLSSPAVADRLRRLEETGTLSYRAEIHPRALGYTLCAIVRISPVGGGLRLIPGIAREVPNVTECYRITGEDCYFMKVYLRSIDELEPILDLFTPHGRTTTSIVQSSPVPPRALPVSLRHLPLLIAAVHDGGMAEEAEEVIRLERARLFGLAYRLLGSASEAEDVVQSAFEKWIAADRESVSVPAAWLTTVVTNLCLRQLGSVRRQRERYTGTWLPEPVLTHDGVLGPLETAEQRESVSFALLVLMERLTPAERAVFVLREAFGYRYADIGEIIGRPEAGCRQLHRRAAQRLGTLTARFRPEPARWRDLTERFLAAASDGDMAGMERLLAADVVSWTDGAGGDLPFARKPVAGRSLVARFFTGLHRKYAADVALSLAEVNGQPAMLAWLDGVLLGVFIPEFDGTAMTDMRIVLSPAKLAFATRQKPSRNRGLDDQ
jgi:RNA polymerase sigma factor (sigma-70 family)